MNWNETSFEKAIKAGLVRQHNKELGERYYVHYQNARNYLLDQVYPHIAGAEPSLSDHSATHISDIHKNIQYILSDVYRDKNLLSGMDLYFLGMIILFHDPGNIFGREGHFTYETITKVYNACFHDDPRFRIEKRNIGLAASAHSGVSGDGSKDTMKDLLETDNIDGHPIRLREMATILRFADELAEGPHRTSQFMQQFKLYAEDSMKFHNYANTVNIYIDKPNERIALTYHISLKGLKKPLTRSQKKDLKELLEFIYLRIHKLDQERKYARHYSIICNSFKRTTVAINFDIEGRNGLDLKGCELNDVIIPGEKYRSLEDMYEHYKISNIIEKINE